MSYRYSDEDDCRADHERDTRMDDEATGDAPRSAWALERTIRKEKRKLHDLQRAGEIGKAHAQANRVQLLILQLELEQKQAPSEVLATNPDDNFPTYIDGAE